MKNLIFLLLLFPLILISDDKANYSVKTYQHDHQHIFNIAKKLFHGDSEEEFIIDTSWNKLQATKRSLSGGLFNLVVAQTIYTLDANVTNDATIFSLSIYTQRSDKKKQYIDKKSIYHTLFWNRLEYALGLSEWINCGNSFKNHKFLCKIDKKALKQ